MQKIIITIVGVLLVSGAVSAFAGDNGREQLAACRADILEHYGEGTRMRLRRVLRGDETLDLRFLVRGAGGGNEVVVCSADAVGSRSLTTRDGVALSPPVAADESQLTLAE